MEKTQIQRTLLVDKRKKRVKIKTIKETTMTYREVKQNMKMIKEALKRNDNQMTNINLENKKLKQFLKEYEDLKI